VFNHREFRQVKSLNDLFLSYISVLEEHHQKMAEKLVDSQIVSDLRRQQQELKLKITG
jgi:hypothetical protein